MKPGQVVRVITDAQGMTMDKMAIVSDYDETFVCPVKVDEGWYFASIFKPVFVSVVKANGEVVKLRVSATDTKLYLGATGIDRNTLREALVSLIEKKEVIVGDFIANVTGINYNKSTSTLPWKQAERLLKVLRGLL